MALLGGLLFVILFAAATIDLNHLDNYASQAIPSYITKNNTPPANPITNKGATLGRVLFYDKNLSRNNSISCASCHQQQFAFSDTARQSIGLSGGKTERHSMRLVNARFSDEARFFWNERAASLENQSTQPIKDHVEMGFSGSDGDPNLDSLIRKLKKIGYYKTLFTFVYGDSSITESRMQQALAQFIRSIQSFNSKFDAGRSLVNNLNVNFPNFTAQENQGKTLFLAPPPQGGAGCQGCHRAPEFDIDPGTRNNGVITKAGGIGLDLLNTRAPSLRDLFNPNGSLNGPLMHNGAFTDILSVINHYNQIPPNPMNTNLDPRLQGPGGNLQLNQNQKDALIAFLKTLTGTSLYTESKWSNPFDANGNLNLINLVGQKKANPIPALKVFPNPAIDRLTLDVNSGNYLLEVSNMEGKTIFKSYVENDLQLNIGHWKAGIYALKLKDTGSGEISLIRVVKKD